MSTSSPVLLFIFRLIFETTRWPFVAFYGGFPVELITHVGTPVLPREGESVSQLHQRVQTSMKTIIEQKRSQLSVVAAISARFSLNTLREESDQEREKSLRLL